MGCDQPDYEQLNLYVDYGSNLPEPSFISQFGHPLIVSNRPEKMSGGPGSIGPQTMYKKELAYTTLPFTIRVFVWHQNKFPSPRNVGLILSATGAPAQVVGARMIGTTETGDFWGRGKCCAKAQLYGTLDPFGFAPLLGATEQIAFSLSVPFDHIIGSVFEFDIQPAGFGSLRVRTANWTGDLNSVPNSWDAPLLEEPVPTVRTREGTTIIQVWCWAAALSTLTHTNLAFSAKC